MKLDLYSIKKAANSMERSLQVVSSELKAEEIDEDLLEVVKAGVIQNFAFTYELCWKYIRRWFDLNISRDFTSGLTRKQLFRHAIENKLISDFEQWVRYHELRNLTSHTYDQAIAEEIFSTAGQFLCDAQKLIAALEERND
ncbi:HI0074 family nucleotidyltransferase substrate-binding subunit [Sporosarcina limicola]|uniref:Nucleotidyltransferase substrate binding protein (TIGR01987 family) n=1 Tax=Sporosarcina limicola TaxID=34101 RepID=A0A927MJQ2_9BACL|nr:HI0074 family nucleotidyltransferase substrate-binding subunit [Sporosarcina limicola]MBE1555640.1 nucleotidyltransferase substrate binding protein (TIGR01987 family) [Sporosarcina limicola]